MNFVLSLFPGIGLLDRAFEEMNFCVVRGPDRLWGGDIKQFHPPPGKFDGIIGGPPCQCFSRLSHMVEYNHKREPDKYHLAENLIPEFERCVNEARPTWFLMENVPAAPDPDVSGYSVFGFTVNNRHFGEAQSRERKFNFGHQKQTIDLRKYLDYALFESPDFEYAVTASGSGGGASVPIRLNSGGKPKLLPKSRGNSRSVADYLRLQGLPEDFFGDKSPFTRAGKRLMIGNGVPMATGRALASAINSALKQVQS